MEMGFGVSRVVSSKNILCPETTLLLERRAKTLCKLEMNGSSACMSLGDYRSVDSGWGVLCS